MIQGERQHASVLLPGEVQEWIMDFDWGTPVRPMEFELTLPERQTRGEGGTGRIGPLWPVPACGSEVPLLPRMDLLPKGNSPTPDSTEAFEPELTHFS